MTADINTRVFNDPMNKPFHEMVVARAKKKQMANSPFMVHVRSDQEGLSKAAKEQGYLFSTYSPDGLVILHFQTRPPIVKMVEYLAVSGFMSSNCELMTDIEKLAVMARNDQLAGKAP